MKFTNYLDLLAGDIRLIGTQDFFKKILDSKKISNKHLAKKLKIPYRSLMNYLNGSRSLPLSLCKDILDLLGKYCDEYMELFDKLFVNTVYAKSTCSHSKPVKLPKIFDENLAYLVGAMHDGCVFSNKLKNQYLIQYVQYSNKKWLKTISDMLYKIFEIKPKQYERYVQLSNKVVYEFFSKVIEIPKYQKDWSSFLKNKPWYLQKYMIIGMFDAEGWCGTKDDLRIKFSQKNRGKLEEVRNALNEHHIHSGDIVVEHHTSHALYIAGKNVIKFITEIGCLSKNPKKIVKLESIKQESS